MKLLEMNPVDFAKLLKEKNITKFYFVYDKDKNCVIPSHSELVEISDFLTNEKRDFLKHEGMFFNVNSEFDSILGAFVHKTNRGQAAGGVRYWEYDTVEEYLRDGLRLAVGMTRKNALAGLWWGGGKGVISYNPKFEKHDKLIREKIYKDYGKLMSSINGCYVTAEDVGTNVTDMANIFSQTRFTTCIPQELGGSGNPSVPTARGVVAGMEAALNFINGETLEGKTIAIQGAGNVGRPLIKFLLEKNAGKIIVCDIFKENIEKVEKDFPKEKVTARLVDKKDKSIFAEQCHIFSPCATGAILNSETIQMLKAKIVCGAANNQLEDAGRDDIDLYNKGIIYVPDFLTNRMGIVNCADEQFGYVNNDEYFEKHLNTDWKYSIYQKTLEVLNHSKKTNNPPAETANKLADELSEINHPIFGHRGEQIIKSLVENKWHLS